MATKLSVLIIFLGTLIGVLAQAQMPSPFIHVDQFGYLPDAEKVAVLSDPQVGYNSTLSFTPGTSLEVRDADTDVLVLTGSPEAYNSGALHAQSGDRGWWFDFSNLTTPGSYVIVDPASGERSARFEVSPNAYDIVMYHALRMFYYNRCGTEKPAPYAVGGWTDAECFNNPGQDTEARYLDDPTNAALFRDVSGGWFDAGDFNKYVTFTETTLHDLLSAYEENPQAFLAASNIPESSNALPDILDEIKWELDWLLKMSNADGSTHIKMGNISYAENGNVPPSNNFDPRYYGPTCTSAALANAGILAHAARVFMLEPGMQAYAATLQTQAVACFAWSLPAIQGGTLQTDCDDGRIKAGDADRSVGQQIESAVTAAWYLYKLTGDAAYTTFLETYIPQVEPYEAYYWSTYSSMLNTALLGYMTDQNSDADIVDRLTIALQSTLDNQEIFGWAERDLYRAHIPDWAYHWGSNNPKAHMAVFNLEAARAGFSHGGGQDLMRRGTEMLHYFHGVNPLGLVMLSNMNAAGAERSVNEIYHSWFWDGSIWENAQTSTYGPAPGFVTGGPNHSYGDHPAHDPNLVPPVGQPAQKSYLDDNDNSRPGGGDNAIYSINEPAIYYQAAFIRLLANFVGQTVPLPVEITSFTAELNVMTVDLAWSVAAETEVATYSIERSVDGTSFIDIGSIRALGSGSTYTFTDSRPVVGINYYRLAVIDNDGNVTYSQTLSVDVLSGTFTPPFGKTSISPNPSKGDLSVSVEQFELVHKIRLIDTQGKVVREWPRLHSAEVMLPHLNDLQKGVYILSLEGSAMQWHLQVVLE